MMPKVVIYSEASCLAINLAEFFLKKFCEVTVAARGVNEWLGKTEYLAENKNFRVDAEEAEIVTPATYVFYLEGFGGKVEMEAAKATLTKATFLAKSCQAKLVVALPGVWSEGDEGKLSRLAESLIQANMTWPKIVYVGEVYGPRMDLVRGGPITKLWEQVFLNREVRLAASDFEVFAIDVFAAVEALGKMVFSYPPARDRLALWTRTSLYTFFGQIQKLAPEISFVKDYKGRVFELAETSGTLEVGEGGEESIRRTLAWFAGEKRPVVVEKRNKRSPAPRKRFVTLELKRVWMGFLIFVLVLGLASPFLTLGAGGISLQLSVQSYLQGKPRRTETFLKLAKAMTGFSGQVFGTINLGFARGPASLLARSVLAWERGLLIADKGAQLTAGVLGGSGEATSTLAREMAVEAESLYNEMSFIQLEMANYPFLAKKMGVLARALEYRPYLAGAARIFANLPELLGETANKTYLVLFQNNMELRPTGGFIGSFALVTFSGGTLVDMNVFDVYAADGQLKGHVEPPAAIKKYLGEANWYLRDANWDPDFVVSGQRVEWFLNKELDRSVDGVIGVDLSMVKAFLEVTGSLNLADFNLEINEKNLYERVQHEVESEFFPGSQKKASFMSALAQALLNRLREITNSNYLALGEKIFRGLLGRQIQVFVHETETGRVLSDLAWDGRVEIPRCGEANCLVNWMGLVEANVGVNKVNYYIEREAKLFTEIKASGVENRLTLTLVNKATPALGLAGRYRVYVRALLPAGAKPRGEYEIEEREGRVELGKLVDVAPQTKKEVVFEWTIPGHFEFTKKGEISVSFRKQAGIEELPFGVEVSYPTIMSFNAEGDFTLTRTGRAVYNTVLTRDFGSRIFW